MTQTIIVDTGILIAYLNRKEKFHDWIKDQFDKIYPPFITCEAVIAESCFLLRNISGGIEKLFELFEKEFVMIPFHVENELLKIKELMVRYNNIPMSFADACLVRMAEQYKNSIIITHDSDF